MSTHGRPFEPLDHLRAEFERRRLTVTEVARRTGVSREHLSDVLWGRKRLTERLARDISLGTRIPLRIVLGQNGPSCPVGAES